MPVILLGAWTNSPVCGAGLASVVVVGAGATVVGAVAVVLDVGLVVSEVSEVGDDVAGASGTAVATAVASSARQPYRDASDVARSPPA